MRDAARRSRARLEESWSLPVDVGLQPYLEDDNLMAEPARIEFRSRRDDSIRGVVADIAVGENLFQVRGAWRELEELRHLVAGRPAGEAGSAGFGYGVE